MQILDPATGWAILAVFGAVMITLPAVVLRHRPTTKAEFLVASRDLSWKRAALAITSNWIWAPALFVAAQQGYTNGWVGVFWFTVPNVACLVLFSYFAVKARHLFPNGFTLSAAAGAVYSRRVQRLYVFALAGLAVCSFAVQLLAGGLVISTLTGISFTLVTVALTGVALAYSLRHGFGASVLSSAFNTAIIVTIGFGLSLAVALNAGTTTLMSGLTSIDHDVTALTTGPGAAIFWAFGLSTTIGLMSGPFGDQSFWQLAWATRTPRDTRKAFLAAAALFATVPLTMSLTGFAAAGAGLTPSNPTLTNLTAILHWLPDWTAIPFTVFVLAGLLSTMDSQLCSAASLAAHDAAGPHAPHTKVLAYARTTMTLMAVVALALANTPGLAVVQLFIFYGTLRASTLIPTMLMFVRTRVISEAGVFYGILAALTIGLPLSAYGNLNAVTPAIWGASLTVLALSGGTALAATYRSPNKGRTHAALTARHHREHDLAPR